MMARDARMAVAATLAMCLVVLGATSVAQPAATPTLDDAAIEAFLLKGRVGKARGVGKGITGTTRATLTDGNLTHEAQIQAVDESKAEFVSAKGVERDFRDSWTYNVAAYRVDRLIGLNMVPVSVERTWNSRSAAFTWWVDDVAMDEDARIKKKIQPPRTDCWLEQMHLMRMFDELIENTDRNTGNTLYTKDWRIWAIDHTRAFRRSPKPPNLAQLTRIDRAVFERLKALEFATLKKAIGRYLSDFEIRMLLSRRDALVAHFTARGEGAFFERQDVSAGCLPR